MQGAKHSDAHRHREHLQRRSATAAGEPNVQVIPGRALTVLNGAEKSEAELVVAGDKLEAKGLKLAKGAKVVAALVTPAAKSITVRFTVK